MLQMNGVGSATDYMRRRLMLAQVESCCVYEIPKQLGQFMKDNN